MAKEQATGLSIHGGTLRWTILRSVKGSAPAVTESRAIPLQLESGDAPDMASLSDADRTAFVSQLRAVRGSIQGRATVALSSEHVLIRSVELPAVDPAELKSMVELQADKFSPFPAESAVTSYETVLQTETSSRVLIATAQRKNVEAMGSLLSHAGIVPRRMDVETLCWLRLLTDAGAVVTKGCSIIILKDKAVCDMIVTLDGIPMIIRGLGRTSTLTNEDVCTELEYTLTSLENEHGVGRADSVTLWHWDEEPAALMQLLKARFDSDINSASFKSLPTLSEGMTRRTLVDSNENLNLTIPEWLAGQRAARLRKQLINASIAAVALWLVLFGGFFAIFQYDKSNVKFLEDRATDLRTVEAQGADTSELLLAAKQYAEVKYSAIACLREVARLKPADLEFDGFTYNKAIQPFKRDPTKKVRHESAKTNQVVVAGHAQIQNTILDFQKALQSKPSLFTKVALGKITAAQEKNRANFTMTLDLPRKTDETP
ncbi:MAG: pilus assembly protein PilM [bacterium]